MRKIVFLIKRETSYEYVVRLGDGKYLNKVSYQRDVCGYLLRYVIPPKMLDAVHATTLEKELDERLPKLKVGEQTSLNADSVVMAYKAVMDDAIQLLLRVWR